MINDTGGFYLDRTPVGWGLCAARDFNEGSLVLTFVGSLLTLNQTLDYGQWGFYSVQIGRDRYLDVEPPGAFINHSCSPNCGIRGSVALIALEDISEGTELVMDYSTCIAEDPETMVCRCGCPNCRGLIGNFLSLPTELQNKYLRQGIVSDFIAAEAKLI